MKVICLGGHLTGFKREEVIDVSAELEDKLRPGEEVVVVAHGKPYIRDASDRTKSILDPDILKYNLHAFVITHSVDATSPEELNLLKEDLKDTCRRVYGLTTGWNRLDDRLRDKVSSFLVSDDYFPYDADVQLALGFGAPVARLALRIALEIALGEIKTGKPGSGVGMEIDLNTLLNPALRVAERDSALDQVVNGIRNALSVKADMGTLHTEVSNALVALHGTPTERS